MQFHLFENECEFSWDPEMWGELRAVGCGEGQASQLPSALPTAAHGPWAWVWFPDYSHGITLATPLSGSEKKQVLHFCALGSDEMQKFVEDLKESIAEVTELEQIRIECKDTVNPGFLRWSAGRAGQLPGSKAQSGLIDRYALPPSPTSE